MAPESDRRSGGLLHVTAAPMLRRCWHPVAFANQLTDSPVARTLLETPIVLWRTSGGEPRAAVDQCPHRWARLSAGTVHDGNLQCPYHGWRFGDDGTAIHIPQLPPTSARPTNACLDMLATTERFGMVYASFASDPTPALPSIPEFASGRFQSIQIGVIRYQTSAPVIIDNNTDETHVAFVHATSFGAEQDPRIATSNVEATEFGIRIRSDEMPIARTPSTNESGSRHSITEMWLPFTQVARMHYSDGANHILVKGCCPVDDNTTDVHLTVLRNDNIDDDEIEAIRKFELTVEHEDKAMLDTVPGGFPLDPRLQSHSKHDRPGIAYRKALGDFLNGPTLMGQ